MSRLTVQAAERVLADSGESFGRAERDMLSHSIVACRSGIERVHFLDGGLRAPC